MMRIIVQYCPSCTADGDRVEMSEGVCEQCGFCCEPIEDDYEITDDGYPGDL